MASWFDSHCHLHLVEPGPDGSGAVDEARAAGVEGLLAVGIDLPSSRRSLELAAAHRGVWASAGVHPNEARGFDGEAAAALEELLGRDEVAAVGETGLDFYRLGAPRDDQERAFSAHIELAVRHDRALVVHTRESAGAALDLLEAAPARPRVIFHCWSGGPAELERALALGAFVSFAGNVTFSSARDLRDLCRRVPRHRLLVETDSPFLSPVPHRGRPNRPANVVVVGAAVAAARAEPVEEVAAATSANARAVLGLG